MDHCVDSPHQRSHEGVVRDINMGLLADDMPEPGQWVMIHLGFALEQRKARGFGAVLADRHHAQGIPPHGDGDVGSRGGGICGAGSPQRRTW